MSKLSVIAYGLAGLAVGLVERNITSFFVTIGAYDHLVHTAGNP